MICFAQVRLALSQTYRSTQSRIHTGAHVQNYRCSCPSVPFDDDAVASPLGNFSSWWTLSVKNEIRGNYNDRSKHSRAKIRPARQQPLSSCRQLKGGDLVSSQIFSQLILVQCGQTERCHVSGPKVVSTLSAYV